MTLIMIMNGFRKKNFLDVLMEKKYFKGDWRVFEITSTFSLKQFFSDLEQEYILILLEPQLGTLLFPDIKGTLIIGN